MTMQALRDLDVIRNDPTATVDERIAADQLLITLPYGGRPTKDQAHILSGYIQRQQAQNRWGQ